MLRIADNLELPLEAVTETFAILAKRGTGKTYTSAVIVEEMLKAALQVVVADPVGVWWGLRSNAKGDGPGLPITILGGDHGDVPLDPNSGAFVADVVVSEKLSVVLDLSNFTQGEQGRFMTEFGERLYLKNREPLHLVIDEADFAAPQSPMPDERRMLGAMEKLVRRGRARGIGVTLITQRPAVLNKSVLTQIEVLIALRTIGPQDRKALEAWINVHGTDEERKALLESLPSLPVGEAWFWSPAWLNKFQRVRVRRRETFDSSSTPKVGEKRTEPKQLAPVDLEKLRERMAAAIEEARADDPKVLKKRLAELQAELDERPKDVEIREIPILQAEEIEHLQSVAHDLIALGKDIVTSANTINATLQAFKPQRHGDAENYSTNAPDYSQSAENMPIPAKNIPHYADSITDDAKNIPKAAGSMPRAKSTPAKSAGVKTVPSDITGAHQRILNALAYLEEIGIEQPDRAVLAYMAGYTVNGHFNRTVGELKTSGRAEYPSGGRVRMTDAGRAIADTSSHTIRTLNDLHQAVLDKFSPSEQKILRKLIEVYPQDIHRDNLAEATGYTINGHFNRMVGHFKNLGFATYPRQNHARAADTLFPDGLK